MEKMKAATLQANGEIMIKELDKPKANPGEIIMKVKSATTCGTDVKTYKQGHPNIKVSPDGIIFGHEASGIVDEIGEGVKNFKVADRIATHNSAPCNKCYSCKQGNYSLCDELTVLKGAWAEYVRIPKEIVEQNCFIMPDDMSHKTASLLEPLSCAVYGVDESNVKQGDTVVVNGLGPIGLMMLRCCQLKGATVIGCDFNELRLNMAKKLGANYIIDLNHVDDQVKAVRDLTPNSRGVDVAIEATGMPKVWEMNMKMARKGGIVMEFGGCKVGTSINIDTKLLHYSQLTIKGVYHTTPRHVSIAFELLKRGHFPENVFITGTYNIDNALDALLSHANGCAIKNEIVFE